MAITGISYKAPYAPLVSATVTPITGDATWLAGTYNIAVWVADAGVSTAGARESAPIYIDGVVLTAGQGIKVDVTWNSGHTGTIYWFVMIQKGAAGSWVYLQKASGNFGGILYPTATNSFTSYNTYGLYPNFLPRTGFPLNNQAGAGVIEIADMGATGTTVTMKQIFDDMKTAGYITNDYSSYNSYNTFFGCWSLKTVTGARGKIDVTGFHLWLYSYYLSNNNFTLFSTPATYPTVLSAYKYSGAGEYMYIGNAKLKGATLGAETLGIANTGSLQIGTSNTTEFVNCTLAAIYPKIQYQNTYDNSILIGNFIITQYDSANPTAYAKPVTAWTYPRIYSNTYKTYIRDSVFKVANGSRNAAYIVNTTNPNKYVSKYLDCQFITYDATSYATLSNYDYPFYIDWNGIPSGHWQQSLIQHSINLTIKDKNDTAINNAVLKIYDKDNAMVLSGTSNVSGVIPELYLDCKKIQYITGSTLSSTVFSLENQYHTVNRRYPFTFTISKDGYDDYQVVYTTLEDKVKGTIILDAITPPIYLEVAMDGEVEIPNLEGNIDIPNMHGSIKNDSLIGKIN